MEYVTAYCIAPIGATAPNSRLPSLRQTACHRAKHTKCRARSVGFCTTTAPMQHFEDFICDLKVRELVKDGIYISACSPP